LLILRYTLQLRAKTNTMQNANPLTKQGSPNQKLQEKAWEILEGATREQNRERRVRAVRALGMLEKDAKAEGLAEIGLDDANSDVRAAAARALGEMRSVNSVTKLEAATHDTKLSVALAAARSLLLLKNNAGYEVYYAVLTGQRKSGGIIAQQMDEFKNPKVAIEFTFEQGIGFVPYAGPAFEAIQMLTKKDSSPIRASAATALANDPDPASAAALARAAEDGNWIVRVAALRAIANRGDPKLLAPVEADMEDKKDEVRFTAAAAVLKLTN
jgi:HEAT repeat protein